LICYERFLRMLHEPSDTRDHAGSQNLSVGSVVKFTVTVWTGRQCVVHGVRSTFGKRSDMMNLQELIAIGPQKWRRFFADLTDTIRRFEYPGNYVWIPYKSLRRSKCLFASHGPWRRRREITP
jgi:hypothetical protein